nr:hypothetical protein [Tanacetum cinerariifolium]
MYELEGVYLSSRITYRGGDRVPRDPVLRLCHRIMAHSISSRSQAPEKEALVAPGGGDEDEEMPHDVPPQPRTQGERIARLEEEVHDMREALQNQREDLDEKKSTMLVQYLQSGSIGVLKLQDSCSTDILAHKLNL